MSVSGHVIETGLLDDTSETLFVPKPKNDSEE